MLDRLDVIAGLLRQWLRRERPKTKRLLRLRDGADYLSVSPKKLRSLIQAGQIAVVHNGEGSAGRWLVDVRDLDEWIERSKV